jgi:hypothetical protein
MGARRLLDHQPDSGVSTYHVYDHDTKVTTIETVQDVAPFLERTRAMRNHGTGGGNRLNDVTKKQIKKGWLSYASIPAVVEYKWMKEHGVNINNPDHRPAVFKLLNSREYAYLKTTEAVHTVK